MKTLISTMLALACFGSVFAGPNPTNPAVGQLKAITPYTSDWSRKLLTNVTASDAIYFIMSDTNAVYSLVRAMRITNGNVNINMDTNYVYGELARQSNAIRTITNTYALAITVSNNALVMSNRTKNITASQLDTNALADQATIQFNPGGALAVKANGISPVHIDPASFALPISGGGGTNQISLSTNSISWVYLKTNLLYGAGVATNIGSSDFFPVSKQATGTTPAQGGKLQAISWDTVAKEVTNIASARAGAAFSQTILRQRYFVLLQTNEFSFQNGTNNSYIATNGGAISATLQTKASGFIPTASTNFITIKVSGIYITNSSADNNTVLIFGDYTGSGTNFTLKASRSTPGNETPASNGQWKTVPEVIALVTNQVGRIDVRVKFKSGYYPTSLWPGAYLEIMEYSQ